MTRDDETSKRDEETRRRIQALEKQYRHQIKKRQHWLGIAVQPGWIPIIERLLERVDRELTPHEVKRLRWSQIKQKWGQLRAYYHLDGRLARLHMDLGMPNGNVTHIVSMETKDPLSLKVDAFVRDAVEEAAKTCEVCGALGQRVKNGPYVLVACPEHHVP